MSEQANNISIPDEDSSNEELQSPRQLSKGVSQFVENIGMIMERYGLPRIGGRIMGLMMLDDKPLSLDDIAQLLGVSRASVSTNLRLSEMAGLAKRVARPGDRRDYYVGTEDMWYQGIKASKQEGVTQMGDAARAALPNIPPDDIVARDRLQEMIDFSEFFVERLEQLMEDWEVYKAKMYEKRNTESNEE